MGWYYQNQGFTLQDVVAYLASSHEGKDDKGDDYSSQVLGAHFHSGAPVVQENPVAGAGTLFVALCVDKLVNGKPMRDHIICVYLVEFGPSGWGYKPMDCCMGPYATGCPDELLDMCPPHDNGCCREFHERQRDYNENQRLKDLAFACVPNDQLAEYIARKKAELSAKGVAFPR